MQAQKEALQSGLVTMHDIEMMVVEDEGSITNLLTVVKQQCNMIAMALFGNVVGPLFAKLIQERELIIDCLFSVGLYFSKFHLFGRLIMWLPNRWRWSRFIAAKTEQVCTRFPLEETS